MQEALVDFSWMTHDIPAVIHSQGLIQWKRVISQRLQEVEGRFDAQGNPLKVVCFLEAGTMPLETAQLVSQYNRQGLSPTKAFISAVMGIDPNEAKNDTLTYRTARRQASVNVNPEILQQLAALTEFHDNTLYKGHIQLEIEGVTQDIIASITYGVDTPISERHEDRAYALFAQEKTHESLALMEEGDWTHAMSAYKAGRLTMSHTSRQREGLLHARIKAAADDPSTYAVVVRYGLGHRSHLEEAVRQDGFNMSSITDSDYRGRVFAGDFIDSPEGKIINNGDSNSEVVWWQALICKSLEARKLDQADTSGDFYGRKIEIERQIRNDITTRIQTMEDVRRWQRHMSREMRNGHNFLSAYELFT